MAFSGDSQENIQVEPNLAQIQQEIEALRQRIGAFYEKSTPTDLDEEEDQTYDPGLDPPLRTSFDPTLSPSLSPPPPALPPPDPSLPLIGNDRTHSTPPHDRKTTFSPIPIPDPSHLTSIKKEKENRADDISPTKPPTDYPSHITNSHVTPYRPPYRAPGSNTNSPFTAKVSNVKLFIRGNTQLDSRSRSSVSPSRHHLPPSIRHSHKPTPTTTTSTTTLHPSTTTTTTSTHPTTMSRISPPKSSVSPTSSDENALDVLVCTPKQEKPEPAASTHVAKKQKLELRQKPELKRQHMRTFTSPEVVAKLEVEQYMLEETLEELYQIVIDTKKQVVLDLASTSVSLTDFQSRVLQQLKAMESKCRTQQKQHQLALFHTKAEIIPKTEGETNSLQDSLNLEKTKVLSLELVVEDLQAKMKDLDALLSERDAALSELLRQMHENGADPRGDPPVLPAFSSPLGARPALNRATSDIDPADDDDDLLFEKSRDLSSQIPAPTPPPVLFPCHAPTDGESHQDQEVQAELQPKNSKQPDNHLQADEPPPIYDNQPHPTLEHDLAQEKAEKEQLQLEIFEKDRELTELRQQVSQLRTNLHQHHEKSQHLDQLRVTQQSNLLSLEVTAKDLKIQNDQLRHTMQEKDRQNAMLVQQNAQLEQEFKELESHAHNLHMLNQHLQTQEKGLSTQHQNLKAQHQRLQTQHGELRKICYDQDHTIADLTRNLCTLQTQVQKLKVQLQQVEQHVQLHPMSASQKLQNLQQSSPSQNNQHSSQKLQNTSSQELPNPQQLPQSPQTLPPLPSLQGDPLPPPPQITLPQSPQPLSTQPHPQPPPQPHSDPQPPVELLSAQAQLSQASHSQSIAHQLPTSQKLADAQQHAEQLRTSQLAPSQPSQSHQPPIPPGPLESAQKLSSSQQHTELSQSLSHHPPTAAERPESQNRAEDARGNTQQPKLSQRRPLTPPERLDVKESVQKLANAQQHAEDVRKRYAIDTDDVEEIQKIIHELEKIFLETFTEISRLRGILQDEGISPTPLPTC